MDTTDIAKLLGSLGGTKTLQKHGKEHFSKAGRAGNASRWKNHVKGQNKKAENFQNSRLKSQETSKIQGQKPIDVSKRRDNESGRGF